jgi:hypothetical protein
VDFITEDNNGGILQIIINHRRLDKIREFLEDQIITLSRKARNSAVRHAGAYFTKKTFHDINTNNCDVFIPRYSTNFVVFKRHL